MIMTCEKRLFLASHRTMMRTFSLRANDFEETWGAARELALPQAGMVARRWRSGYGLLELRATGAIFPNEGESIFQKAKGSFNRTKMV